MGRTSPTQRSLKELRKRGLRTVVVERWNPYARIRQDLFGVFDLLAIGRKRIIAVQVTSYSNLTQRRKKIIAEPAAREWVQAGGIILLHGWVKKKGRWQLVEENMTNIVLISIRFPFSDRGVKEK